MTKVLITGAAGLVGGVLRRGLGDSHELSGVDRRGIDGFDMLVADSTDLDSIRPAFEGKDVVIDLASNPDNGMSWQTAYENNIRCTYNALQAAKDAGVKRVIFASSNHVTGLYESDPPYSDVVAGRYDGITPDDIPRITTAMPIRPDGPYGIVKALGEAAGRYFSDEFGLSVICLRIGTLNQESRPQAPRQFATLLTHNDLVQLVDRSIRAPDDLKFGIYYGVSNNRWRFWDISEGERRLGYRPEDDAESRR
ncbi:MAG: NAD(P)-dependent oxidoreductase [Chloroflexi bacterium]|nr:NAD(P)-dependent oxidoreductase [Chloroflexota bacterium]